MLRPAPSASQFSVQIKDHALIFFLPQADQQSLWRFDLDALIEQAFRVTGRDGFYFLSLDDLDGNSKIIARFVDKAQAEDILHKLHQALVAAEPAPTGKTCCKRWFGWLTFWRVIFLLLAGFLAWYLFKPVTPRTVAPAQNAASAPAPTPSGVPLDADNVLE